MPEGSGRHTTSTQLPIAGFRTVQADGQLGNIRPHGDYFAAAGTLPSVSWIVPYTGASEHPRPGLIDHQVLSFDSYLRLIEDRFLSGQRLDPSTR